MNAIRGRARRMDGYSNLLSGLGAAGFDRTVSGVYTNQASWKGGLERYWASRYSAYNMADIYLTNGLAQKIIDRPADDCFMRGVEIEGDDDNVMSDEFDRLAVLTRMSDAVRWSRLFGGSVLLLIARDGGDFIDPLNLDALDRVEEIRVLDVTVIKPTSKYYPDDDEEHRGQLEFYNITVAGQESFEVHETRLIPMGGEPVPAGAIYQHSLSWAGRPVLEGCLNDLARYGQALEWSLRLLERKQQAVYNMEGLGEMLADKDDDLVTHRINMVDMVRGILNSVVIDKDDTYTIQNLGLDGIKDILGEYQTALCSSSGVAKIILFGETVGGLNSSGGSNLESHFAMVSHISETIARPTFEKLISILWLQKDLKSKIPDKWKLEFNPLWQPTEKEEADTEYVEAQANNMEVTMLLQLMNNSIITPEEVRKIVVTKYNDYDFPDEIPDGVKQNIDYAEGVDPADLQVPEDKNAPAP